MNQPAQSEYIRYNNKSALIRRWIATILADVQESRRADRNDG